jgi:hypothetical protein
MRAQRERTPDRFRDGEKGDRGAGERVLQPIERELLVAAGLVQEGDGPPHLTRAGWLALCAQLPCREAPRWDRERRTLSWRGRVIRRLPRRAVIQFQLLSAFEEDGWPVGPVDDPLPGKPGSDPCDRLRDAVRNLNNGLPPGTIRFHTDGSGAAVWWEAVR